MLNHLLPLPRLLLRASSWLACLRDLLELGGEFQPPSLSCAQADHLGLIGVQSALALPLQTLPPLQEVGVLRGECRAVLWLGLGPGLMQAGNPVGRCKSWLRACQTTASSRSARTRREGQVCGRPHDTGACPLHS